MSAGAYIGIGLVIGGGLGLLIGWLLGRSRAAIAPADSRLENDLQQRLAQREAEQRTLQEQLQALNQRSGELGAEVKSLTERLATERQQIETIQEKFRKEFEAVSNKLILDNASRFNQQSTESLGKLLTPLKETLGEFKTSLDTTRRETATHSALLKEQISRIGNEAANLSKALKGDVKALGNWGENMLDQILEKSGLQKDIHYRRQRSAKDAEGDQRFLDVIVELPDKRNLVIDSKVSLRAYEESVNAADDPAKLAGLDRHVEALRKHFRDLGAKRYQDIHGINTPDFVLMYVPIEAAFFAAIAREPGLFAEAGDHNVVLITNSTLLATLRTVANVWRLADQQKHVLEIADRGGKLYDKFVGFVEDLQAVGDSLGKARKAWEDASIKLHTGSGNLVSQTEKLKQLGAKAAKSLPNALLEKANEEISATNPKLRLPSSS
jgi:DNA recombination protein RmuC